ncbi:hypothetical protein M422DRAFT_42173 [Sphaerobolus stellatus SS14]|nr:hypothetical protein M422DRAFT_42173 [Sphaerobolus stellatus SS14]
MVTVISQQLTVEENHQAVLAAVNSLKAVGITSCLIVFIVFWTWYNKSSKYQNASFYVTPPEGPPRPSLPYLCDVCRKCRVDIIVGNVNSFVFPESKVIKASNTGLSLLPYIPALLSKVLVWPLHVEESKNRQLTNNVRDLKEMKASNDIRDIKEMLELDLEKKRRKET